MATDSRQLARSYLNRLGYKDDEIVGKPTGQNNVYDIYVKDQYFGSGTPEQGHIRMNTGELDSLYNRFRGNQTQNQSNQLLDTYRQNITQPIQPFTYDVNQIRNSPEFQSGMSSLLQDAQSATNRGLVSLGRRGIGNSQSAVTMTTANQQNATNQANNELLPRLIAEQYQKYVDQNMAQRQQNQDILGLAGVYGDQASGFREEGRLQQEATARSLEAERLAEAEAQQAWLDNQWTAAEQTGTLPNDLAAFYGLPPNTKTLEAERVGITRQNAQTSAYNAQTSRMNAGTSAGNLSLSRQKYEDDLGGQEFASQVMAGLNEFDNANDAQAWLNANSAEITRQIGYDQFLSLQDAIPTLFGKDTSAQDAAALQTIRNRAVTMANQDQRWFSSSAQQKEQIIQEYINLLRGS